MIDPLFQDNKCPWVEFLQASSLWQAEASSLIPILQNTLNVALNYFRYNASKVQLSVLLTDNDQIQLLNAQYRGQDKPTNVLSFPQENLKKGTYLPNHQTVLLGDIVLAYEYMKHEIILTPKTFEDHAAHLILHGFLHLLGFDHETKADQKEMEQLEIHLLSTVGIKNPYEI